MAANKNFLFMLVLGLCIAAFLLFLLFVAAEKQREAVTVSYFNGTIADGHSFIVLYSSGDIPYREGNMRDPGNYSKFIRPPAVGKWPIRADPDDYGKLDSVRLYTWSEKDGLLIRWDLGTSNSKVVKVNANLMDVAVGDYEESNGSLYIPALGINATGTDAEGIFKQYRDLYANTSYPYSKNIISIHGGLSLWSRSVFEWMLIADDANRTWYALEPGYLYDTLQNQYNYDISHQNYHANYTFWGYYRNNSTGFHDNARPLNEDASAFYVSYYSMGW